MNKVDYIKEAMRQLTNTTHYEELPNNILNQITKEINNFIELIHKHGHITKEDKEALTTHYPRLPCLYLLPKIHKTEVPGRPIVSATQGPTDYISAFIDFHIKPLVKSIPSYIRDTTDFLNKINSISIGLDDFLVTMDVSSLYTNIPHHDGIAAIREALNKRIDQTPHTWILLRLVHFVLNKNFFEFNGKFYLQKMGTAMGTKMAPNYANLFMQSIEEKLLNSSHLKPKAWYRFIDDIWFVWPHSEADLLKFIGLANNLHPTIKFTYEYSLTEISFLDVLVKKTGNGIVTTLYTKPTDAHLYLNYHSCHPVTQKKSIPYSQALRIRRICSNLQEYDIHSQRLIQYLAARGYPLKITKQAVARARILDRTTLLQPIDRSSVSNSLTIITTHHPHNPLNSSNIKKHWEILGLHRDTTHIYTRNVFPWPTSAIYR